MTLSFYGMIIGAVFTVAIDVKRGENKRAFHDAVFFTILIALCFVSVATKHTELLLPKEPEVVGVSSEILPIGEPTPTSPLSTTNGEPTKSGVVDGSLRVNKDPSRGTDVGKNDDPGPGPDANLVTKDPGQDMSTH